MKTKIEKGLRYLAAGIFFMALLLNVKFTLDSPYFLTGNELVAQTTGTGTGTGTGTTTGTGGGLPVIEYSFGESKSCVKEFCITIGWDPVLKIPILSCTFKMGTKVDCDPGGGTSCQPSACL